MVGLAGNESTAFLALWYGIVVQPSDKDVGLCGKGLSINDVCKWGMTLWWNLHTWRQRVMP